MEEEHMHEDINGAIDQDEFLSEAKEFFEVNRKEIIRSMSGENKVVQVDFDEFSAHSPELAGNLIDRPEETVQLLEVALEELEWAPNDARVRFMSISKGQEMFIRYIRSKHLGKMISIEGIVRQASEVRPLVTNAKFECPSCGTIISVLQIDKKFKEPSRCSCGRRGGFKEIAKDMVDAQVLTIEEASDNLYGGEQPKRMTIFLKEDLVDPTMEMRTTPGSRVKIIGILKEIAISTGSGAMLTRFDLAIESNNIIPMEESFEDIDINEEDERAIRELAADPKLIDKMVDSIAPSIWGKRDVKKALAFQLFGGVKKTRSDGTKMRGDIHVLLVGDPGVAKSVMLGFVAGVAPKARYVSGKSSTGAGLTATVVKDEILKGWGLEAGAMVLANKGIVCIDEFDKMDEEDRSVMHEAMEQQTITIAKATVQATLRAQTSVLAAANPKFGRFDPLQSIPKQVNLVPSLLSRFDAIFIMRDIPGRDNDEAIATHVLLEHKQEAKHDVIDKDLLKKYISYAKQKYNPVLGSEAIEAMKSFYVGLRNMPQIGDGPSKPIPIGARQLEAMVRLAEAHARMRLSEKVDVADAVAAIDLVKSYLLQVGYDKTTKTFDVDKITGNSASARNKIGVVIDTLSELEKRLGKLIPLEEISKALEGRLKGAEVDEAVGKLLKSGDLFRPKRGFVQRM
ncbi:minichromosome maintenance protein MCM [archaeon]|jgi:replicative DNA helicase Mcm|nr:minichromosome maintenance protein MCM [archaeon]